MFINPAAKPSSKPMFTCTPRWEAVPVNVVRERDRGVMIVDIDSVKAMRRLRIDRRSQMLRISENLVSKKLYDRHR